MSGVSNDTAAEKSKQSDRFINAGVIFDSKGRVLLVRRAKKEIGKDGSVLEWSFPGGKQRLSETRAECVRRKVLEKTGYEVKSTREIAMHVHPQFLVIIVYHLCELMSPKLIQEPTDHDYAQMKWVKPGEISELVTSEIDPAVQKLLGLEVKSVPAVR